MRALGLAIAARGHIQQANGLDAALATHLGEVLDACVRDEKTFFNNAGNLLGLRGRLGADWELIMLSLGGAGSGATCGWRWWNGAAALSWSCNCSRS